MSPRSPRAAFRPMAGLALAILFLAGCLGDASDPVSPEDATPQFHHRPGHAGGPGGPGDGNGDDGDDGDSSSEEIVVESIDPDTASQGTTLDVTVRGEGFEEDSELAWELEGEPTDRIVTLSSRVVNSKRLVATVSVASDAPEALFDVVVQTQRGRRGVGIEMFEVTEGNIPTSWTFDESESAEGLQYKIVSDGRMEGPYVDGECGVSAIINVEGSGEELPGDALLRTAWSRIHPRDQGACEGRDERQFRVFLDDPVGGGPNPLQEPIKDATFANINDVEWVTGEPELVGAALNLPGCNLRFDPDRFPATNLVRVTPIRSGGTLVGWDVETTGDHVGTCAVFPSPSEPLEQGHLFHVPFRVEIRILSGEAAAPF